MLSPRHLICSFQAQRQSAELLWSFLPGIETQLSVDDYIEERIRLQDLAWPSVSLLPGVERLIKHLDKHKIPMAVATGSIRRNFELKRNHLGHIFDLFG